MDVLEAVFGPAHVDEVRAAVAQVPASTRRWLPVEVVAGELGKAGIAADDLATAIEAVRRIVSNHGGDPMAVTDFVASAAAIGDLSGPQLLLIPTLARYAAKAAFS